MPRNDHERWQMGGTGKTMMDTYIDERIPKRTIEREIDISKFSGRYLIRK